MSQPPQFFRTPASSFDDINDFPYLPHYADIDGLQMAYIDAGPQDKPTVFFLHGEPTWSYLWRNVIPPVVDAGFRCIAPDLLGFGRSDKPTDIDWYSYDRHTKAVSQLIEQLHLQNMTIVVHDWGGPIGLRVATQQLERITRIAVMNTGIFTGAQKMSENWLHFRSYVEKTADLPISTLIAGGCKQPLSPETLAAYDAPFPTPQSKTGARAFPLLVPTSPKDIGANTGREVLTKLQADQRPTLIL